jgi:hypothetical protein
MPTFKFTNKETYLTYRSEWKVKYNTLGETIREYKWMNKAYNQAYSKSWVKTKGKFPDYYLQADASLKVNPRYQYLLNKYKGSNFFMEKIRKTATAMLEELKLAKQEAQQQYLADKKN